METEIQTAPMTTMTTEVVAVDAGAAEEKIKRLPAAELNGKILS